MSWWTELRTDGRPRCSSYASSTLSLSPSNFPTQRPRSYPKNLLFGTYRPLPANIVLCIWYSLCILYYNRITDTLLVLNSTSLICLFTHNVQQFIQWQALPIPIRYYYWTTFWQNLSNSFLLTQSSKMLPPECSKLFLKHLIHSNNFISLKSGDGLFVGIFDPIA